MYLANKHRGENESTDGNRPQCSTFLTKKLRNAGHKLTMTLKLEPKEHAMCVDQNY